MPWPTNSRTTEYPCASTCAWTAWPMSDTRPPTRTCAMPRASASWVTTSSRSASAAIFPTGRVTAQSP